MRGRAGEPEGSRPDKLSVHAGAGLEVPAGGYGGWKSAELPLEPEHTAPEVMHAWDCGTRGQYPGWHRAVEYLPRARAICRDVFPGLLEAVRRSPLRVFHVVGGCAAAALTCRAGPRADCSNGAGRTPRHAQARGGYGGATHARDQSLPRGQLAKKQAVQV